MVPEVAVDTHEAIATGQASSKFGTPLREAPDVIRRAAELDGVRLDGLQAHAGSQVLEVGAYVAVARALREVAGRSGLEPTVWDVGGGFGVTYGTRAAPRRRGRGDRGFAPSSATSRCRWNPGGRSSRTPA